MTEIKTPTHDEIYWDNYYKLGVAPEESSGFAKYVAETYSIGRDTRVVELGCGNGRDASFFASLGAQVLAFDICESEINELNNKFSKSGNLQFDSRDFTRLDDYEEPFDVIYSRFTLHSVNQGGQDRALSWAARNLAPSGKFCIETRGQKNELYKKGSPVDGEKDAFVFEDHYRRFVDFSDFKRDIVGAGFDLVEAREQAGFAPFKGTDYQFIRVVAEQK